MRNMNEILEDLEYQAGFIPSKELLKLKDEKFMIKLKEELEEDGNPLLDYLSLNESEQPEILKEFINGLF